MMDKSFRSEALFDVVNVVSKCFSKFYLQTLFKIAPRKKNFFSLELEVFEQTK